MNEIEKPIQRSKLRQFLGKEYFILKRKWQWWIDEETYAQQKAVAPYSHLVFKHQSLILRPLQGLDMQLQENKRTNLGLAVPHLHLIEIPPQTCFSLWKLVGRPSQRKGYLEGLVLKEGKVARGTGGGLCQLGNLLFWLFAHSPLTIKERHRHGYDVFPGVNRKVPFGAGATLAYNYIDLQVKNETNNSFVLELWLDATHLHGQLTAQQPLEASYRIEERNSIMKQQFWGGYSRHNQIFKITTTSEQVTEELLFENHAIMMYEPFLERGSGG